MGEEIKTRIKRVRLILAKCERTQWGLFLADGRKKGFKLSFPTSPLPAWRKYHLHRRSEVEVEKTWTYLYARVILSYHIISYALPRVSKSKRLFIPLLQNTTATSNNPNPVLAALMPMNQSLVSRVSLNSRLASWNPYNSVKNRWNPYLPITVVLGPL